jgi:hypothetical protein
MERLEKQVKEQDEQIKKDASKIAQRGSSPCCLLLPVSLSCFFFCLVLPPFSTSSAISYPSLTISGSSSLLLPYTLNLQPSFTNQASPISSALHLDT